MIDQIIPYAYLIAAGLLLIGLKCMSSEQSAKNGIIWVVIGLILATLITFAYPEFQHFALMSVAIVSGAILSGWVAAKTKPENLPHMIALFSGMGGGAAAAIAAVELLELSSAHYHIDIAARTIIADHQVSMAAMILILLGGLLGSVAFSGSLIAFARQMGGISEAIRFGAQRAINVLSILAALILGGLMVYQTEMIPGTTTIITGTFPLEVLVAFFTLSLVVGVMITMPVSHKNMPVIVSLFNALTGLAVGFEGYALGNPAMMIAGSAVASGGLLLTRSIAKPRNAL